MENYLIFDFVLLFFIIISALLSFLRGFSLEFLSLVNWVLSLLCSYKFGNNFETIAIFNCSIESLQKASSKHDSSIFILADENRFYFDKYNQQLAFEPNDFGYLFSGESNSGSIGGVVACNFAGSRRFKVGSVRDHLLGFQGVNGKGETIKSGGTVVKNVTGYDLCKILSGSFGTLTVLTEISIKVLPKPETSKTLIIKNPHVKKALDYLGQSLSSSTDPANNI